MTVNSRRDPARAGGRMGRRIAAALGVVILALSLAYLLSGWVVRLEDARLPSDAGAAPCMRPAMSVAMAKRRISKNDSEVVTAVLSNTTTSTCAVEVSIHAPGFQIDPPAPMQSILVAPGAEAEAAWVVSPVRTGTHRILVKAGLEYRVIGVVVTNVLGLTDRQAKWVSVVGTFFGSSLTLPWLYEAWQARKRAAAREAQTARIAALEQQVEALRDERARRPWWQFWR